MRGFVVSIVKYWFLPLNRIESLQGFLEYVEVCQGKFGKTLWKNKIKMCTRVKKDTVPSLRLRKMAFLSDCDNERLVRSSHVPKLNLLLVAINKPSKKKINQLSIMKYSNEQKITFTSSPMLMTKCFSNFGLARQNQHSPEKTNYLEP